MKIEELIQKYNLKKDGYCEGVDALYGVSEHSDDVKARFFDTVYEKEMALNNKYADRIPKGWYGFSLGTPTPVLFFDVIEEFLDYAIEQCPNLVILQVKIKFGGLRLYIDRVTEQIAKECFELQDLLFDSKLIY